MINYYAWLARILHRKGGPEHMASLFGYVRNRPIVAPKVTPLPETRWQRMWRWLGG